MYGVVAACLVFRRGIAQHELCAQFLGNLGIDVIHRVLLFGLEVSSTRLLGNTLEGFLAVGAILLWSRIAASPGIATTGVPATGIPAPPWIPAARVAPVHGVVVVINRTIKSVVTVLMAPDVYGVDHGFGLLTRFN